MNGKECKFISSAEAARITSLHPHTLRKYADNNQVKCYKTPSGQRKYDRDSLEKFCNPSIVVHENKTNPKTNYIYSRVSSKKQLDDLLRQTQYLLSNKPEYASYISLSDVASGINFKRKGLQTILDSCLQGTIGEIVIAHRDRLCRFGFELLEFVVVKNGNFPSTFFNEDFKELESESTETISMGNNKFSDSSL